jgi:hypothetical protein
LMIDVRHRRLTSDVTLTFEANVRLPLFDTDVRRPIFEIENSTFRRSTFRLSTFRRLDV